MKPLRQLIAVLAVLVVAVPVAAESPDARNTGAPSELSFLETGKDYVIRFTEGDNIFKTSKAEVTQAYTTTADGTKQSAGPATWNMTFSVSVFHVVRFGGGSWTLLRHPANVEDAAKWFGKRRAMAILASNRVAELEAEPDGAEKLAKLREAADREIETDETWVNLDHAVAIADVPTEEVKLKFNIRSIKTKDD